ncbi:hypothetical protein NLG97_g10506 [Lecanicillium saksenae]|uniref:Uncharacterized protein n=1 Tax=Lecanicillium saksenae TaxID=468837 RepID=A0ACC1QEU0_9HYPO|nr:hypothetical protein NLG97_g10506 [Lecanicillium saksenae]
MAMHSSAEEPLLAANAPVSQEAEEDTRQRQANERMNFRAVAIIFVFVLISDIGYFISRAPLTRTFEDIICRQYFDSSRQTLFLDGASGRPDESQCKIPEVQGPVAELFGYQTFLNGLVGILLGLYFGTLADRVGRRPIFVLGAFGGLLSSCWTLYVCWMEFPLRYVWLSSVFLILGGGDTVVNVCLSMILTDSTPASSRSRVFLFFTASNLGSEVIAPPIASYFINSNHSNPWVPLLIGLGCTGGTVLLAACVPETLARNKGYAKISSDETEEGGRVERADDGSFKSTLQHTLRSLKYISGQRVLLVLVCVFTVSDFARQSMLFLVQYVSVRYRLTLGQANYLLSWRATAAIILNVLVLPITDKALQVKWGMSPRKKDLTLARISIWLFTAGFLILALAPTVALVIFGLTLYTLGGAFGIFMRSMISTMVEPDRLGSVYSSIAGSGAEMEYKSRARLERPAVHVFVGVVRSRGGGIIPVQALLVGKLRPDGISSTKAVSLAYFYDRGMQRLSCADWHHVDESETCRTGADLSELRLWLQRQHREWEEDGWVEKASERKGGRTERRPHDGWADGMELMVSGHGRCDFGGE